MTDHAPANSAHSARRYPPALGIMALMLATILSYLPAIHAEYIWDDDSYVTANPHIRDIDGLQRIWIPRETPQYYPMVFTSFWVEYQLWELDPMGYHLTNVLLHAMSAVLLWIVMIRLKVPGAWLIAAVFALHPVMVESVAWISERKNVMSMFFYLSAALAYLRFDRMRFGDPDASGSDRESWGWYGAALLLFLAALLSKTVTCSLPAALILVMLWLRVPISPRRLLPLLPMFVVGFVLAMMTVMLEREHVGAQGVAFDSNFIERSLIASKALLFYPWKLLWPHPLMFIYPRWEIDAGDITTYWSLLSCAVIGLACIVAYRRGCRGPFVALAFYAGTVFPAIGFFNVYPHIFSFVADHFVYHASIGIIALVIGGGSWIAGHITDKRMLAPTYAGLVLLPILFVLTWNHATAFYDAETLYRDNIAKNPDAWMPRNNLSSVLLRQAEQAMQSGDDALRRERAQEAADQARAVLNLRPGHHTAHANLSEALRLLSDLDGALDHMKLAVEHLPHMAHYRWQKGRLHHLRDEHEQAIEAYAAAVERAPERTHYRTDLVRLLIQQEYLDAAATHLAALLEQDRADYFALSTLGAIRQHQQRDREAMRLLRRATEAASTPEEQIQTVTRLIRLHTTSEDPNVRNLDQAHQLADRLVTATGGDDPGALAVLASVHAEIGHINEAVRLTRRAIERAERAGFEALVPQLEAQLAEYQRRE